jgi:hypothetical protein
MIMQGFLLIAVCDMDPGFRAKLVNEVASAPSIDLDMEEAGVRVALFEPYLTGLLAPPSSLDGGEA